MACFHPLQGYRTSAGDVVFVERGDLVGSLVLPCGRCIGCRLERARQWSVRIMHEARMYEGSSFVTLTYDDEHAPRSLRYRDFQLFMKRLRRRAGIPVRFFMCGEYGGQLGRPHFHAGLFGLDFRGDRYEWRKGDGGYPVFRSPFLESCWTSGLSELGELTSESAAYMARYTLQKVNGDLAKVHYLDVDGSLREPEFAHMSLKPGIGARWFERFNRDVYPHDRVVVKGVEAKPPRYYDKLLKRLNPDELEQVQQLRILEGESRGGVDTTVERLADREKVAKARAAMSKRKLK